MVHIDGSYMEGGGQILRTALALSTLTRKPFTAVKIRNNRPKPGLKHQHLTCIEALKQLTKAKVKGDRLGSASIEFYPGDVNPGRFSIHIGTAGSIALLLQSLLLPAIFAEDQVRLVITGGTDTKWSIPVDYFSRIILPFFNQFASVALEKMQRGFYPKGRGLVELLIIPRYHLNRFEHFADFADHLRNEIPGIQLTEKGILTEIEGISAAAEQLKRAKVSERQIEGAAKKLGHFCPINIDQEYCHSVSTGTVITLWALTNQERVLIGADALGQKGNPAEAVGAAAAQKLLRVLNSDAALDTHLADNLIPLLALVGGRLKTAMITGHIRSNIYVCEKFLDITFRIDEKENLITAE